MTEILIAKQVRDLLDSEDVESLVYLLQSILPRLEGFWDHFVYIQTASLLCQMTGFVANHPKDDFIVRQLRINVENQLDEAQIICMEQFELLWILPYLRILHSPEQIQSKIIYPQELANFCETPQQHVPPNLGLFLVEMVLQFLVKARDELVERQETQQTTKLLTDYWERLVKDQYITRHQAAYLREYVQSLFPNPAIPQPELQGWVRQRLQGLRSIDSSGLLPFERTRLDTVKLQLELTQTRLLLGADCYSDLLADLYNNTYARVSNVSRTSQLLDHSRLERVFVEVATLMVEDKRDDLHTKQKVSARGLRFTYGIQDKLAFLPSTVTLDLTNSVLLSLATFTPHLGRDQETAQALSTMVKLGCATLDLNRETLQHSHTFSGDFFHRLALVFLSIGQYSDLDLSHKKRAFRNAVNYARQGTAIYDFIGSVEAFKTTKIEFLASSAWFTYLVANPEADVELESTIAQIMSTLEDLVRRALSQDELSLLTDVSTNLKLFAVKALVVTKNPPHLRSRIQQMKDYLAGRVDLGKYGVILQEVSSLLLQEEDGGSA